MCRTKPVCSPTLPTAISAVSSAPTSLKPSSRIVARRKGEKARGRGGRGGRKGEKEKRGKNPRDRPGQFDCQTKSRLSKSEKKTVVLFPPTCKRKSSSESRPRNRHRVPFKIRSGLPKASTMSSSASSVSPAPKR